VYIQVGDNGSGIPAEDLSFIFGHFWHGDRSHESSSGLGLAIARQLVQAHGGSITVQSQLNQGTTFTIDLPDKSLSVDVLQ
jgi:signal transduction histidine kinase